MNTVFLRIPAAAAWLAAAGLVWAPCCLQAAERFFGALQMAPEHRAAGREAGWRVALVPVSWDRFEPEPGVFDEKYIREIARAKEELRGLGYLLQLDLGIQYPPAWAAELPHGRYKNQFGDLFVSKQPGEDLPNVIFNAEVRKRAAAYMEQVFVRLGTDWGFVRLGCGKFGELNFPAHRFNGRMNCYWAFDDLAQGKVAGLAEGLSPCPVPGWMPGTPSPEHADAERFIEWYLDCLKNYQGWQIATVRRWYAGDVCMLYGSWGLRPGWLGEAIRGDLAGSSSCELNGEVQQGFDWTRMIGGLRDERAIVYCTWMDGTINNRDIADDNSPDPARWSPAHWQASLARANPHPLRVWGENTGRNSREAMRLTFERIRRFDLMGVMWAFDAELFSDPNPKGYATFSDYSQFIRDTK